MLVAPTGGTDEGAERAPDRDSYRSHRRDVLADGESVLREALDVLAPMDSVVLVLRDLRGYSGWPRRRTALGPSLGAVSGNRTDPVAVHRLGAGAGLVPPSTCLAA